MGKTQTPRGLKDIARKGRRTLYWIADETAVAAGYTPKTVNLEAMRGDPDFIAAKCAALNADLDLWRMGYRRDPLHFDGTIAALLSIYRRHDESSFRDLKPHSREVYEIYIAKLEGHIGRVPLSSVTGLSLKSWHRVWSSDGKHIAASSMCRAVLKAAGRFGVACALPGAQSLMEALRSVTLPKPQSRTSAPTTADVVKVRKAARAASRPSRALAYALSYETGLRLWDVTGQWYPLDYPGISDVIHGGKKWIGPRWEDISADMVLSVIPTKTERRTGLATSYDLKLAPMVLEEIAAIPAERRRGPLIVDERTGRPPLATDISRHWRADRKRAGLPGGLWARDLRAGASTESRRAGAAKDDVQKLMAHSSPATTEIYNRDTLEAARRIAHARIAFRKQDGNGSGNAR